MGRGSFITGFLVFDSCDELRGKQSIGSLASRTIFKLQQPECACAKICFPCACYPSKAIVPIEQSILYGQHTALRPPASILTVR